MRFLSSIGLLVSVVLVICVPYFVGHGLAVESSKWILAGVICGVLATIVIFITVRTWPRAERRGRTAGHEPHA